jgi:hypothetical protein
MTWELAIGILVPALGLVNAWLIFIVNGLRTEMSSLRAADIAMGKEMSAISVLVAGNYVTKGEFNQGLAAQTQVILSSMKAVAEQIVAQSKRDH